MSVFVTGDIHGKYSVNRLLFNDNLSELTADDIIIVCGDFGLIWASKNPFLKNDKDFLIEKKCEDDVLDELSNKPWTTVFVDGNHENFTRLNSEFEVVDFCGGKAHKIRNNIYHLIRGNIFTFNNKKYFVFGGARSHDIQDGILDPSKFDNEFEFNTEYVNWVTSGKTFRIKNLSWWEEELPKEDEFQFAEKELDKVNWEVDYVISHCAPNSIASYFCFGRFTPDILTNWFQKIADKLYFKKWYFGHYHTDSSLSSYVALYENIIQIDC